MAKFLQRKPLEEARRMLLKRARPCGSETISTDAAHGRVTARAVLAVHPSPHYRASAMDGIAVCGADTLATSAEQPLVLTEIASGQTPVADTPSCLVIDTGGALPDWADAVVRIENTRQVEGGFEIREPAPPGRDVRPAGEDVASGTRIVPRGHRVRPYDIGAMLGAGVNEVSVVCRPRVAVLATGAEIVEPGNPVGPGEVIEYNSRVIGGLVREWGGEADYLGCVPDEEEAIERALTDAAHRYDAVAVIAGSSVGRKDLTVTVLNGCGTLFVHGVDIMPGKPVALATIGETPVIGLPGYPVSTVVACEQLMRPLLAHMTASPCEPPATVSAEVRRKIPSRLGVEEFRRVCLCKHEGGYVVAPLPHGAGAISSVVRADGWLRIPSTSEGVDAGTEATVELLRAPGAIASGVVVTGAIDALSTALEDIVRLEHPEVHLTHLARAESDGVDALSAGEAHMIVFEVEEAGTDGIRASLDERLDGWRGWTVASDDPTRSLLVALTAPFAASEEGGHIIEALEGDRLAGEMGGCSVESLV